MTEMEDDLDSDSGGGEDPRKEVLSTMQDEAPRDDVSQCHGRAAVSKLSTHNDWNKGAWVLSDYLGALHHHFSEESACAFPLLSEKVVLFTIDSCPFKGWLYTPQVTKHIRNTGKTGTELAWTHR